MPSEQKPEQKKPEVVAPVPPRNTAAPDTLFRDLVIALTTGRAAFTQQKLTQGTARELVQQAKFLADAVKELEAQG